MSGIYRGVNSSAVADAINIDGDRGDIVITNSGADWVVDENAVTFAKMQDLSADVLIGNTGTPGNPIEIPCTAAGRALLDDVDAAAQRTTLGGAVTFTDLSTSSGSSLVGFIQSGTGAVARTLQSKNREYVSVKDFGAVGDGITDDTAAVLDFLTYLSTVEKGEYLINPGDYLVSSLISFSSLNSQNDGTARNILISGYGARLVSTSSTGTAFLFNDVKDLTISGLTFATANDNVACVEFDGCWYSTFNDCTFPLVKFAPNNSDTFESHYWNKWSKCKFKAIEFYTGSLADKTEFNSNAFYSCRIFAQGSNYALSVYGTANINGVDFYNCDISYYETGLIYVDQTLESGTFNFYGGYWDGKNPETSPGAGVSEFKNLQVNCFGFLNNPSSELIATSSVAEASRQVLEMARGARSGSRLPISSMNLIRNGDLRHGAADLVRTSPDFTVTERNGIGLFGKYINVNIAFSTRGIGFVSVPLPFDGQYTATALVRDNGSTSPQLSIRKNNVEITGSPSVYVVGEWKFTTFTFPTNYTAGDIVEIRAGGGNPSDFDIAYVGLTFGSIGLITASAHPDAVSSGLVYKNSLVTYDPASLADGVGVTTTINSQSSAQRRPFLCSFSNDLQSILAFPYYDTSNGTSNTIGVRLQNETGGTIDLASGTLRVMALSEERIKSQSSITYNPANLADGAGVTTSMTVFGAALGDFALPSFGVSMQGMILFAWVSAADTVSVRFQNETGASLDLASSTLNTYILKPMFDYAASSVYDPASLADGAGVTTTIAVTGAALGDFVAASFSLDLQGVLLTAWVSAANTVSVRFQNESNGTIDLASGTIRVGVIKSTIATTV